MRATLLIGSLTLLTALGCGGAMNESSAPMAVESSRTVAFTQWSMEFAIGEDEYYTVDFLGDGTWLSDGEGGNTWSLAGDALTMTDSDGYRYDATFVDSWTVGGTVTQPDGETWPFRMTRRK